MGDLDVPKALFVVPVDGPGGAERVIAAAVAELTQRPGWDVRIVSLSRRVEISFLDGISDRVSVSYGLRGDGFLSEWAALRRILGRSYDLVFASHFRINVALCCARRIGLLWTRRLVTRESTVLADRSAGLRWLAYRALYRLYGAQDEIWSQTRYMASRIKQVLSSRAQSKVRIVANPIDVTAIRTLAQAPLSPNLETQLRARAQIGWCGRLIEIKDPCLAVRAFARALRVSGMDLGLVMIGAGPLRDDVAKAARAEGIQDRVLLAGHLQNPYPVLASCRLGMLTSAREGFPNVLLEMMCAGVEHIVTTPCAGDLESLSGVEIVPDFSAEVLGDALARAIMEGSDQTDLYGSVLSARSPAAFIDRMLGIKEDS